MLLLPFPTDADDVLARVLLEMSSAAWSVVTLLLLLQLSAAIRSRLVRFRVDDMLLLLLPFPSRADDVLAVALTVGVVMLLLLLLW